MLKHRVTVSACTDYNQQRVDEALETALQPLGGMSRFVQPGQRVLVKCNLLMKRRPEAATTTHPALVAAVVKQIQSAGGIPVVGDSPGGPFIRGLLEGIYDTCGLTAVAEETGCELNYDTGEVEMHYTESRIVQSVPLIKAAAEADVIINVPKLKTHGITLLSAGVKNLYGLIPGLTKIEYHLRMPDHQDFSAFLVELCRMVKPALTITDAIVGMEGAGPSGGEPIEVGAIIASGNPFAHDVIAALIAGVNPQRVTTIAAAKRLGIHSGRPEDVEIVGDLEQVRKSFRVPELIPRVDFLSWYMPRRLADYIIKRVSPRPVFLPDACVKCGICVRSCPPQALSLSGKMPVLNLDKCIRCFCCHEMCPPKAIKIHRPRLARWLFGKGEHR